MNASSPKQSTQDRKPTTDKKRGQPQREFQDWAPAVAAKIGVGTLAYFMMIAMVTLFRQGLPDAARFPLVSVLALGSALSSAFLGGSAAAKGTLPIPFFKDKPIQFSVVGGIAVFVIIFILANWLYPTASTSKKSSEEPVITTLPDPNSTVLVARFVSSPELVPLADTLQSKLEQRLQSSFKMVSEGDRRDALLLADPSAKKNLSDLELCTRANAKALVRGDIVPGGQGYMVTLHAENCCSTGTSLGVAVGEAKKDDVSSALEDASAIIQKRLERLLPQIKCPLPDVKATTESAEAFKKIKLAEKELDGRQWPLATKYLKEAIREDPNFALADARLATVYDNLGEENLAIHFRQSAYRKMQAYILAHPHGLSDEQKYYIEAHYSAGRKLDYDEAMETYRLWENQDPEHPIPRNNIADLHGRMGNWMRSLSEAQVAKQRDPHDYVVSMSLATAERSQLTRNLQDEANVKLMGDIERLLGTNEDEGGDVAHEFLFEMAFLNNDEAAMEYHAAAAKERWEHGRILRLQAQAAASHGKLDQARSYYHQSTEEFKKADYKDNAAFSIAWEAATLALLGYFEESSTVASAALASHDKDALVPGPTSSVLAALALALSGRVTDAKKIEASLAKNFPNATLLRSLQLPMIDTIVAIKESKMDHRSNYVDTIKLENSRLSRAIAKLEEGRVYEMGNEPPALAAIYIRGLAYLERSRMQQDVSQALLDAKKAEEAFQNILDHPGIDPVSPFHALAHFELACARKQAGDRAGAKSAYDDFRKLWENADADVLSRFNLDL